MDPALELGPYNRVESPPAFTDLQSESTLSTNLPFREVNPVEVSVTNLSVHIDIEPSIWDRLRPGNHSNQPQSKTVLEDVSVTMPKGSLTALIGGSGSGKTSLLNAMARRTNSRKVKINGSVTFNGKPNSEGYRSAYVRQEDVLMPTLSVRETLQYAADLRLPPPISKEERRMTVEQVIDDLALKDCANTRIGKCSGGEKRRTSIGIQMLASSSVLFCDEPTTGLDATNAYQVANSLKKLGQSGRTVIISIHAPRSEIWNLFDNVVLLSGGSVLYAGEANSSMAYFTQYGYYSPPFMNPAEFLVDLAALDTRTPELETKSRNRISSMSSAWRMSSLHSVHSVRSIYGLNSMYGEDPPSFREEPSVITNPKDEVCITEEAEDYIQQPQLWWQLRVLTARTFKTTLRDPMGVAGSLVRTILMSVLNGWIFVNLDESLTGIRSRQGSLYVASNLNGYIVLLYEAFRLAQDIRLFDRERDDGVVGVPAFLLSRRATALFLEDLPAPTIFSVVFYFMVGFRKQVGQFFIFFVYTLLTHYTATTFAAVSVGLLRSVAGSNMICNLAFTLQSFTSGYLIQTKQMPVYVRWLKWASYMFYVFSGLCANEFAGQFYDCPYSSDPNDPKCKQYKGDTIMSNLGFPNDWKWKPIVILVGFALGFLLIAGVLIAYNPFASFDTAGARNNANNTDQSTTKERPVVPSAKSPHQVVIGLENYRLYSRKRNWMGRSSQRTPILQSVTTQFRPGELNVIMGPSGSGKTSLLNSMAKRLHKSLTVGYELEGLMLYNGAIPTNGVIRSATCFVTQADDALIPTLTVRETLQYAAQLRLPSWMSKEEKLQRTDDVLLKMGLKECADNVIGDESVKGISGGEKRRVTIAVQLLTDPRILLLDEPTSGLDVFTTQSIIQVLNQLAAEGRTVVMTIHQSRASIFYHFSHILLLATGGHQVYAGKGEDMVPYFASLGYECPKATNPADFVLDVVNTDQRKEIKRLTMSWDQLPHLLRQNTAEIATPAQLGSLQRQMNPFYTTFPLVLRRSALNLRRRPSLVMARSLQVLAIAVIVTLFYAPLQHNYEAVQSRMGFIQEFAALYFVGLLQNVAVYPNERDVFYREEADNCYSVEAFILQYTVLEIPFEIVSAFIFGSLASFVCNLHRTAKMFLIASYNCFCIISCGESVGIMFSTVFGHLGFAVNILAVLLSISTVLGGILSLNVNDVLSALNHLSPVKYLVANLAPYSMKGQSFSCSASQQYPDGSCPINDGTDALKMYNLDKDAKMNVMALGVCTIVYRLVAYALLKVRRSHLIEKIHDMKVASGKPGKSETEA